jgi:hypothetical protein
VAFAVPSVALVSALVLAMYVLARRWL